MVERPFRSWWRSRIPDLSVAVTRFPLAVAIVGLLTLYKLLHDNGDFEQRVMGALAASFLFVVASDLYVESQRRALSTRVVLWVLGILVIALLFWLQWDIWLSPPLLLGALLILVGLSGHLGRKESNATFWLFNHRLWLGAMLALAGAALLGAGLYIIHETLQPLFGISLWSHTDEYIWTVCLSFVAPVSFLAFAPRSFTDPITEREEGDFTMRAVAALVKFVLVPLLLVYTAILYAYAIKIVFAWELPKGTLGSMVVGYLLVGAATLLLGYPVRETGGVLVRLFWRYWVWLAALPVVLLFIAVSRRIGDYGLTEDRYLMVLVGVWALILAVIRVLRGGDFDLRLVPGVLALLFLAASFGPGGMIGFSIMSQKAELASLLTAKGMLVDGKIVARQEGGEENPLGRDAGRARTIEWYLNTHRALAVLAPWFEGLPNDPFAPGKKPVVTARDVLVALGLRPDVGNEPGVAYFTHYSDVPAVVALPKDAHVVGPVVFQSSGPVPVPIPPQTVAVEGLGTVHLDLADNLLNARLDNGDEVTFDIRDAVKEIYRRGWPLTEDHRPLEIKGSGTGLTGTALIDNLKGSYKEPQFELSLVRLWLVLGRAE
jgi:Domain of unknown function (DUF4153)